MGPWIACRAAVPRVPVSLTVGPSIALVGAGLAIGGPVSASLDRFAAGNENGPAALAAR